MVKSKDSGVSRGKSFKKKRRSSSIAEETGRIHVISNVLDDTFAFSIDETPQRRSTLNRDQNSSPATLLLAPSQQHVRSKSESEILNGTFASGTKVLSETSSSFRFVQQSTVEKAESKFSDSPPTVRSGDNENNSTQLYRNINNLDEIEIHAGDRNRAYQRIAFGTPITANSVENQRGFGSNGPAGKLIDGRDLGLAGVNGNASDQDNSKLSNRPAWRDLRNFFISVILLSQSIWSWGKISLDIYRNGKGAFLVAYFLALHCLAAPLMHIHIVFGNAFQKGPLGIWSCSPSSKGIGQAMVFSMFFTSIIHYQSLSYATFYLGATIFGSQPWSNCDFMAYVKANVTCNNVTSCPVDQDLEPCYFDGSAVQYWMHFVSSTEVEFKFVGIRLIPVFLMFIVVFVLLAVGLKTLQRGFTLLALLMFTIVVVLLSISTLEDVRNVSSTRVLNELFSFDSTAFFEASTWLKAGESALTSSMLLSGTLITLSSFQPRSGNLAHIHFQSAAHGMAFILFTIHMLVYIIVFERASEARMIEVKTFETMDPLDFIFGHLPNGMNDTLNFVFCSFAFIMFTVLELFAVFMNFTCIMQSLIDESIVRNLSRWIKSSLSIIYVFASLFMMFMPERSVHKALMYFFDPIVPIVINIAMIGFLFVYGSERMSNDVFGMIHYKPSRYFKLAVNWWLFLTQIAILLFSAYNFSFSKYPTEAVAPSFFATSITLLLIPWAPLKALFRCLREGQPCRTAFEIRESLMPQNVPKLLFSRTSDYKRHSGRSYTKLGTIRKLGTDRDKNDARMPRNLEDIELDELNSFMSKHRASS